MIKECPACASMNTVYSELREQTICRDCGMIFEPYESTASFSSRASDRTTLSTTEAPVKKRKAPVRKAPVKKAAKKAARKKHAPVKKKATKKTTRKAASRKPAKKKTTAKRKR